MVQPPGESSLNRSSPRHSSCGCQQAIISTKGHATSSVNRAKDDGPARNTAGRIRRSDSGGLSAVDCMLTHSVRTNTYTRAHARSRVDAGFTLIESLTAATILLLVAAAVITVLIATSGWYAKARMRTEATAVANNVMSLILARNYSDIRRPVGAETWPAAIPEVRDWASAVGTFSVETSLVSQVDTATGLPMIKVIVTASPLGQVLDPPVSIVRYASGWQEKDQAGRESKVTVEVQIRTDKVNLAQSGVRVQLLDSSTMVESHYAVTDGTGVAHFENINEGDYFLTSDPRFGTDIRPLHFPERVYPTHLGSKSQAEVPIVKYSLEVARHTTPAMLSVGAFVTAGFNNPQSSVGNVIWDIEKPYRPVTSLPDAYGKVTKLMIYARPVLNVTGTATGIVGSGSTYPDESRLGPYSAEINDYGVAHIEVPWTIDPSIGQYWEVWCTTRDRTTGVETKHPLTDYASGGWGVAVNMIDLLDQTDRPRLPQFIELSNADPVNTP